MAVFWLAPFFSFLGHISMYDLDPIFHIVTLQCHIRSDWRHRTGGSSDWPIWHQADLTSDCNIHQIGGTF